MRVLFLTKKFPLPLKDGECIAILSAAQSLANAGVSVDLLAINTLKHYTDPKTILPVDTPFARIDAVTVDTKPRTLPLMRSLLSGGSYNLDRFNSQEFSRRLERVLLDYDYRVVQLEGLHLHHYIPLIRKHSRAKIVMRSHNVEHEVWQKLAENETGLRKRLFRILANRIRVAELAALTRVDGVVTLTENDAAKFKTLGFKGPMMPMPIGIAENNDETIFHQPPRLFHIGSMDWLPNIEGLKWFVANVWKPLNATFPSLSLHLAGRCFPPHLFDGIRGVTVHGEVDDAKRFIGSNDILVVPLFSGSGVRLKILEAMSMGKAVIATAKGAEGIPYTDNHHLLVANDAAMFVEQIKRCLTEHGLMQRLGEAARALIQTKYNPEEIGNRLRAFYVSL